MFDTETIDRLFLELSQFTQATTKKELDLLDEIIQLKATVKELHNRLENLKYNATKATAPENPT